LIESAGSDIHEDSACSGKAACGRTRERVDSRGEHKPEAPPREAAEIASLALRASIDTDRGIRFSCTFDDRRPPACEVVHVFPGIAVAPRTEKGPPSSCAGSSPDRRRHALGESDGSLHIAGSLDEDALRVKAP
jgi:hypothetical protein